MRSDSGVLPGSWLIDHAFFVDYKVAVEKKSDRETAAAMKFSGGSIEIAGAEWPFLSLVRE
jgi:hypothetical protein